MNGIVNAFGVTKPELDTVQTTLNSHTSDTENPHSVTKAQVGLDKVDNTSDKDKPVSDAQKAALDVHTKNITVHITDTERKKWNSKQDALTFDSTPKAGSSNPVTSSGIKAAIDSLNAATDDDLTAHTGDATIHITDAERTKWNAKQDKLTFSTVAPVMDGTASAGSSGSIARSDHRHPTDTSRAAASALTSHTGNTTVHITADERTKWNNLQTTLNKKANLSSPTLTGTPKAPTAAKGTNSTQIATTAFVATALATDEEPTKNSNKFVTSGAVYNAIQEVTMPIWYVSRKPVSFTLAKGNWNGTTYSLTIPDTYKVVDEYVQVGIPSQSSEANTEQLLKSAITVVVTATTNPITISAVMVPTTDVTIALFGLEEVPPATETPATT